MKNLVLVVRRELVERKMLMAGALAIGLVVLVVPLFTKLPARDVWNVTSLYASIMFGLGIAFFAASSILASDLRERRLSFFLGRPLSTATVWGGKMLAAWLLALICTLLVLLPVSLLGSGLLFWLAEEDGGTTVFLFALVAAVVAIPLGHALGVALRARSSWLLADFVALALAGLMVWAVIRPLAHGFALGLIGSILGAVAIGVMVALLIAGNIGFAKGRIDLQRVHAHQSMVTTAALLLIGVTVSIFGVWVRGVEPHDLSEFRFLSCMSPDCQPVIEGTSPGRGDYRAVFAMSGDTFRRLESVNAVRFAPDRQRLVWESIDAFDPPLAHISYTDSGMDTTVETKISIQPFSSAIAVSPNGDLLAVFDHQLIQIIDLAEERVIRTISLRKELVSSGIWFTDNQTLLVLKGNRRGPLPVGGWRGVAADVTTGDTRDVWLPSRPYLIDPDHRLVLGDVRKGIFAYSTETWTPIVQTEGSAAVLSPQGIVVARPRSGHIAVIDPSDGSERIHPLPGSVTDVALGPVTGDVITIGLIQKAKLRRWLPEVPDNTRLASLNLTTGDLRELQDGLVPARAFDPGLTGPYFLRRGSAGLQLVRMDPVTHQTTLIAGRAS